MTMLGSKKVVFEYRGGLLIELWSSHNWDMTEWSLNTGGLNTGGHKSRLHCTYDYYDDEALL